MILMEGFSSKKKTPPELDFYRGCIVCLVAMEINRRTSKLSLKNIWREVGRKNKSNKNKNNNYTLGSAFAIYFSSFSVMSKVWRLLT